MGLPHNHRSGHRLIVGCYSNMPSPHATPVFETWAETPGVEVRVVFATRSEPMRHWNYRPSRALQQQYLSGADGGSAAVSLTRSFLTCRRVFHGADVVVLSGGYSTRAFLGALVAARSRLLPTVFWGERPYRSTQGIRRLARSLVIRAVARSVEAIWGVSPDAVTIYRQFDPASTVMVPYVLDVPVAARDDLAGRHGSRRPLVLAQVGELSDLKRPTWSLQVLRSLLDDGIDAQLVFIGDGPLRSTLEKGARDLPVRFLGRVRSAKVMAALNESHVLLHPSREDGWGMAPVEALVTGNYVIGSTWTDSVRWMSRLTAAVDVPIPDKPEAYADAVRKYLAQHPDLVARQIAEGISVTTAKLTPKTVARATLRRLYLLADLGRRAESMSETGLEQ